MNSSIVKALVRVKLQSIWDSMTRRSRNGKKRNLGRNILYGILFVYLAAVLLFYFGFFFYAICVPYVSMGLGWLYFGFAALLALILSFLGSVFTTQSHIYRAKDNDLLLSMPIKPQYILASRLMSILAINYCYSLVVFLPAGVAYCLNYTPSAVGVIFYILASLALPLLSQAIACFAAWVFELISSRMKRKNLITMVLSLGFLFLYFIFISKIDQYLVKLLENGEAIAGAVKKAFPPAYFYGVAVTKHSITAFLASIAISFIPFAAVYYILSKNFISVVSSHRGAEKRVYVEKKLSAASPSMALLGKELRHFTSNAAYMLNSAMGGVFAIALSVFLIIKSDTLDMIMSFGVPAEMISIALAGAISLCVSMNFISAPSISLEARTIWILQTMPVKTKDILMSKVNLHFAVTAPFALISSLICAIVMKPDPASLFALFAMPLLVTLFCGLLGVVLNLQFPKFNWTNEVYAIKQGISSLFAMLASLILIVGPAALYITKLTDVFSVQTFAMLYMLFLAAVCAGLYAYLCTGGSRRFSEL